MKLKGFFTIKNTNIQEKRQPKKMVKNKNKTKKSLAGIHLIKSVCIQNMQRIKIITKTNKKINKQVKINIKTTNNTV